MTPEDVVLAVGQLADERRWDALRKLFADNVIFDYGDPEWVTPEEIIDRWRPLLSSFDRTEHNIDDLTLMVDGDRADCISEFEATHWMVGAPGGDSWTLRGEYIHKLKQDDGDWYITKMQMIPLEESGNKVVFELAQQEAEEFSGALTRRKNRGVLENFFAALEQRDVETFRELWRGDSRQEMPFSPPGHPDVLDGKDQIISHYAKWLGEINNLRFNRSIIATTNPNRFVVTYTGDFTGEDDAGHFHSHYVGFFEIENGKIVTLTEYANPDTIRRITRWRQGHSDRRPPIMPPPTLR